MTWDGFYKWLEGRNVKYHAGDIHFTGRGWWYPTMPKFVDSGRTDQYGPVPIPDPDAGPWVHVTVVRGETKADPDVSVFVTTSFGGGKYAETPEKARELVELALMDFDVAAGAEPLDLPPMRFAPAVERSSRGRPISQEAWDRHQAELQREWRERNKLLLEKSRPSITPGPEIAPRYKSEQDIAEEKWLQSAMKRRFEGITSDDSDVSDSCDLGAHERCTSCGCGCHQSMAMPLRVKPFNFPKHCGCGRTFTEKQWEKLKLKGHQVIEADAEGPEEVLEVKDCPSCFSTLAVQR